MKFSNETILKLSKLAEMKLKAQHKSPLKSSNCGFLSCISWRADVAESCNRRLRCLQCRSFIKSSKGKPSPHTSNRCWLSTECLVLVAPSDLAYINKPVNEARYLVSATFFQGNEWGLWQWKEWIAFIYWKLTKMKVGFRIIKTEGLQILGYYSLN